jgi:hypothetical protein
VSKSAHRRGGLSRLAPAPPPPLRTVRDVPPPADDGATSDDPNPTAGETSTLALSTDTSLLTLFEAILGAPPGDIRDRSAQVQVVEAQITALRQELGLPDPAARAATSRVPDTPPPTRTPDPKTETTAGAVLPPHDADRRSPLRALVAGLTTRRKYSVGMTALASTAGVLW